MRARASFAGSLFVVLALTVAPADAFAQKKKDATPVAATVDLKPAIQKLSSSDEGQVKQGLDEIRIKGAAGAAAAPAVGEALSRGLSLALTQAALETLGDLESEAGSAALAPYCSHRDPTIRRSAAKALVRTRGAPAVTALRRALSDSDALVRSVAASGLGALKAKDAVGDLFVALDHRINESAASIGQLCQAEQCDKLTDKLGKLPFDVIITGLDQILFRPSAEVNDDTKIKVVSRVRELGTMEANRFLREVQKRWKPGDSPRVRQAIDQAVLATSGGSQ